MASIDGKVVILGTGGTIAGRAESADDTVGYSAGEIDVADLVRAVPALAGAPIETEQVAQLDSKDMDAATWQRLARRVAHHLARPEVAAVVVTHGTDTLEETAWFLQRVLAPAKPVVLVGAMRPASARAPDGPRNLADAVAVARSGAVLGVVVVLDGAVHEAAMVRKAHTTRVDAFTSGDAGPLASVAQGQVHMRHAPAPTPPALGLHTTAVDPAKWPWVAVVANHAGSDGRDVRALASAGASGFVVAGTGNGTLSAALEAALRASGRPWIRSTRCAAGPVVGTDGASDSRSPWQARVDLLLELLTRPSA
jgi:L-asparaginase